MSLPLLLPFEKAIAALEAAGETTRLRLIALLAEAELTVTELTAILGQSQPRVSRHLKLLVEAGLVDRHREGAWAFFRRVEGGTQGRLIADVLASLDPNDPVLAADRRRLGEVRAERAQHAAQYFARHAAEWDRIRALHVPESRVETAMAAMIGSQRIETLLDIGTGTGRILELFAGRAGRAIGIDASPAMLNVARVNLERAGIRNVQLRQGDVYALTPGESGFSLIVIHQVLHFLDDPARAVREAARLLAPSGRLLVVDLAPHGDERLRTEFAHRRLGFSAEEIAGFMVEAGLEPLASEALKPLPGEGDVLTVALWMGRDRRLQTDAPPRSSTLEVA